MAGFDRAELREVSEAVLAVTSHLSAHDVLRTILTSARRLLGARYAALGVPDGAGSFAEFLADGISDEQWREIGPVPRQHGLLGVLLRDPNPVRLTDIREHPDFGWWPQAHPQLRDFLGMPIVDGGEILGEIYLANKPDGFSADDEELLRLLAAHAAIALVNARLYERSRELTIVSERNRIARELHDAVTQKLFSLRLTVEAMPPGGEVAAVAELAAEITDELRAVVVGLRPAELAGDGLEVALRKQADLLDRVHEAAVRFTSTGIPRLNSPREEAAYRIAQEALHNALRHGGATNVHIGLSATDSAVTVAISDDGTGFDATADSSARRLGMTSMRERARAAGARLDVRARNGTSVVLEVPAT